MADDPNPELRAEYVAALAVLAPQIRGLHGMAMDPDSSPDLIAAIRAQITVREHRRDLINAVIGTLDEVIAARAILESDGYPALPNASVVDSLLSELSEEMTDIEAAVAIFQAEASRVTINLGEKKAKS